MRRNLILLLWLSCAAVLNAVTFNVTVPDGTKECYIAAKFNNWDATNAIKMTPNGVNQFTLDLPDITENDVAGGFKYLCGPDWIYVEKNADGTELASNRTIATDNDVVARWASLYNSDVITEDVNFDFPDGLTSRKIQILLPPGYDDNPDKQYPVIYMQGIRQTYHNVGNDNAGDAFFKDYSWNLSAAVEDMYNEGKEPGIVVAFYGFLSEFSPWSNNDFVGTGKGDQYLDVFVNKVIPYINGKYRTLTDAESTTLAGADMGGLISYYAALKYPDKFGKIALFSPSFWFNKDELTGYVNSWSKTGSQKMYFIVGDKEGIEYKDNTKLFYELTKAKGFNNSEIYFDIAVNGLHDDVSWGKQFNKVYSYLLNENVVVDYQFMSHSETDGVECTGDKPFESGNYYPKGETSEVKDVMVYMNTIAADFVPSGTTNKSYYFNINTGSDCSGTNLFAANKSIGFSNKKNTVSWSRIIINSDQSVDVVNASRDFFKVIKGTDKDGVVMTQTKADGSIGEDDSFTLTAEVAFSDVKTFSVYYGSVNSGSLMSPSLFDAISVPSNCTKAQIIYCFKTNKVEINVLERSGAEYRFMDGITQDIVCNSEDALVNTTYYAKDSDTSVDAKVLIKEVPVSINGSYYWNLNIGNDCSADNDKFFETNKSVGFSSSKKYVSWLRVVVYDDLTSENVAASSAYFRIFKDVDTTSGIQMTQTKSDGTSGTDDTYTVSGEVEFSGSEKGVQVYFGSVNSGSKQSALTKLVNVSDNCSKAQVIYSFKTNKITVIEKEWNRKSVEEPQPEPDPTGPAVVSLIAVPSFCKAGTPVTVTAKVEDMSGYTFTFDVNYNYGSATSYPAILNENGEYECKISSAEQGIYHVTLVAKNGGTQLSGLPTICVKVPYAENEEGVEKILSSNAYEGIDWSTIGKYKANFHTHTSQSFDTSVAADVVIDKYREKGYKILALTDHDGNTYPWTMLDSFDSSLEKRDPIQLGMLTFSGVELSKDNRNNWSEATGGEFNHHNDFFTGRKGQEFASLQESYTYTQKLGGMQIINHPGQYWDTKDTVPSMIWDDTKIIKNTPAWHADNFKKYESLIGLEVINQGNRWKRDRVYWDMILNLTMPERTVYGYSNDDSHNFDQYYKNYQYMLMDELSISALKEAMKNGQTYFSFESGGTGNALAPRINSIIVDDEAETISIDTPNKAVYWISSTDHNPNSGYIGSSVVGYGKIFCYKGFQGKYVRAMITNQYGETHTQPFGFTKKEMVDIVQDQNDGNNDVIIYPNPASDQATVKSGSEIESINLVNMNGQLVKRFNVNSETSASLDLRNVPEGIYIVKIQTKAFTKSKLINVVK